MRLANDSGARIRHHWVSLIIVERSLAMSLSVIAQYIFTDDTAAGRMKTITWLQARGLLANTMHCNICSTNMDMVQRNREGTQNDKWAWRCPVCSSIKSIRSGSWFEGGYRPINMLTILLTNITYLYRCKMPTK